RLALLVRLHFGERLGIRGFIVLDRNLRPNDTYRVDVEGMTRLDQRLGVVFHERRPHRHERTVGETEVRLIPEFLDAREDVVPASAVEPRGMLAELVEDLLHLDPRPT